MYQKVSMSSQLHVAQAIEHRISEYKTVVSAENVDAEVSHFVMMEGAYKRLLKMVESQKNTLGAVLMVQQHTQQGAWAVGSSTDLPLSCTIPGPPPLKPGAVLSG
jgi:hypothetical protein